MDYSQTNTKDNKMANLQSRWESLGWLLRFQVYKVTSVFYMVIHHKTGFNYMDSLNNLRGGGGGGFLGAMPGEAWSQLHGKKGSVGAHRWATSSRSTRGQEGPTTAETLQVRFHLHRGRF